MPPNFVLLDATLPDATRLSLMKAKSWRRE
jgi:hypothetical protein